MARTWPTWPVALVAVTGLVVALRESFHGIFAQWSTSANYSYGYLVVPAACWLLWRDRHALVQIPARPSLAALLLLACALIAWTLAVMLDIAVIHHLLAVALVALTVWTVMGTEFACRAAFPLAYLFLAVHVSEVLIQPLMSMTADFAVFAVRLHGIAVHQDGLFFSLPVGDFEVIDACSGVRFLMATIAASLLYAWLVYRSWQRRLVFVVLAVGVSIVANLFRAYGVVMLMHATALDFDHVFWGTVYFAVVLIVVFAAGARFAEADAATAAPVAESGAVRDTRYGPPIVAACVVTGLCMLSAGIPAKVRAAQQDAMPLPAPAVSIPGWQGPRPATPLWRPQFIGAVVEQAYAYHSDMQGVSVDVHLAAYGARRPGSELVSSLHTMYDAARWRVVVNGRIGGGPWQAAAVPDEVVLRSVTGAGRVVWWWYVVDGEATSNPLAAKWRELRALFRKGGMQAFIVAVSTPFVSTPDEARRALVEFIVARCAHAGIVRPGDVTHPDDRCMTWLPWHGAGRRS